MTLRLDVEKSKAILDKKRAFQNFVLTRFAPTRELDFFVNHYWIVKWDLPKEKEHKQEVLSHPCIGLVIEKNDSRIVGVITKKYEQLLQGKGIVFAVMFRPGGFYPFYREPVSKLTNREFELTSIFGETAKNLENDILSQNSDKKMVQVMEQFLKKYRVEKDPNITLVNEIISGIMHNKEYAQVDDVVAGFHLPKWKLQRLFNRYVGVNPKWVIARYRLHEVMESLAKGAGESLSEIAYKLGYFDQAHFGRDFKKIIGASPMEYKKSIAST